MRKPSRFFVFLREITWNLIGQAMGELVSALAKVAAVEEDTSIAEARLTLLQGSS